MKLGTGRRRVVVLVGIGVVLAAVLLGLGIYFKGKNGPSAAEVADASKAGAAAAAGTPGQAPATAGTSAQDKGGKKKDDKGDGKEEKSAIPVSVAAIGVGPVSSYISSTANLVAEDEVKVLGEAEGRVAVLRVDEGDRIGRGEVLASLVRDEAEITLRKAQLRSGNALEAYERAAKMVAENLMSREAFDKAKLDNEVAQQELAESKWRLEKTTIRAPFGGRVTQRNIQLGQHIRPGDTLFTVSDFDPLIARIYLPEKDIIGLKEGREVRITLKANETTRFRGRIRQISPVVDTATGTVKVTVEAIAPPAEVRPGSFVSIDVVRETHPKALLVPREAVVRELQEAYVFVVRGQVAEKRTVSLGLEEGGHVEAISGVAAGDQVIVAGQGSLKQGSQVKIIPAAEASDLGAAKNRAIRG